MVKQHRKRASTKRANMSRRRRTNMRRSRKQRRQGGGPLMGAPLSYHLAGDWSSRMSLGQGTDYFKYHEGQHGGADLAAGPFPAAVERPTLLPADMVQSAMQDGPLKAYAAVAGLTDPRPGFPNGTGSVGSASAQAGGKRHRKGRKSHKKSRKARKARKSSHRRRQSRRQQRKRGGAVLGYAPVNAPGMLLPNKLAYDEAGLNPDYRGAAVEYKIAEIRDKQ